MDIRDIRAMLIDGDGVLWHSDQPIPGLHQFFDVLANRQIRWVLLTNNSTRTADQHAAKLRGFDVECSSDQVFSSGTAAVSYLRSRFKQGDELYVIGEAGFRHILEDAGFIVCHGEKQPKDAAAVVATMDRELTYDKLKVATLLIRGGLPFIATNTDRTLPTPEGMTPGTGSIIAALVAATDTQPTVLGKPEPPIFDEAVAYLGIDKSLTAVLGDRLETDILGGQRAGLFSIAVLTGVATRECLATSDIQPDWVFESVQELAASLQ